MTGFDWISQSQKQVEVAKLLQKICKKINADVESEAFVPAYAGALA